MFFSKGTSAKKPYKANSAYKALQVYILINYNKSQISPKTNTTVVS